MVLMLLAHSTLCFVEHTGFLACSNSVEQTPSSDSSEPMESEDCCHAHSHGLAAYDGGRGYLTHAISLSAKPDRGVPEAPIREIDYPPQLS